MSEQSLHAAVCTYIRMQYPKVLFNSDASGVRLTIGQAKKMKQLRSSRAYPDLVIYEPRNGFHGLFIELKKEGTKIYKQNGEIVSDEHIMEQFKMLCDLCDRGYNAVFSVGFESAKQVIDEYLKSNN